jgi:Protein of unknown function (DUF1097)
VRQTPLIAGALSAAVLAGATVWIFANVSGLWVWAAFIGWASYDQSGANPRALFMSSTCMVFGVVMAWPVAVMVAGGVVPLPTGATSALAAALASFLIVWASQYEPLSNVPATFYGFASAFAFLLLSAPAFSISAMTSPTLGNVLICVPVSLLIGSVLGVVHQQLASLLTAPEHRLPGATRLTPLVRKD